jgi:hypothetical protein
MGFSIQFNNIFKLKLLHPQKRRAEMRAIERRSETLLKEVMIGERPRREREREGGKITDQHSFQNKFSHLLLLESEMLLKEVKIF